MGRLNSETINVTNLPHHTKVENIFRAVAKNAREKSEGMEYVNANAQAVAPDFKSEHLYPVAMYLTKQQKEDENPREFISRALKIAERYESPLFGFSGGSIALVVTKDQL